MEVSVILTDADGTLLTGKSADTSIKACRVIDGFLLDWNDMTFKDSSWIDITDTMSETDSLSISGKYHKEIDVTNWSDGFYQFLVHFDDGTTVLNFAGEHFIQGGREFEYNIDVETSSRSTSADVVSSQNEIIDSIPTTQIEELYKIFGLDPSAPLLVTLTSRTVSGINQVISIDTVNRRTTVTRV